MKKSKKAHSPVAFAFAPATVANVAVGFDVLGFAVKNIGEWARVEKNCTDQSVIIDPIENFPELSTDPKNNSASAGLIQLVKDKNLDHGFRIKLKKSIPIGSGLGGSSTSAVASIFAANALLKKKLNLNELLEYALIGETVASQSRHADNIAPCLVGGLVLVHERKNKFGKNEFLPQKINTPKDLFCVLMLPKLSIKTSESRNALKKEVPLHLFIQQSRNLACFLHGCEHKNYTLIKETLSDIVIEPQRAAAIPHFYDFQKAALSAGALGFSLSGSGPALFSLCRGKTSALKIKKNLTEMANKFKLDLHEIWITQISNEGVQLRKGIP